MKILKYYLAIDATRRKNVLLISVPENYKYRRISRPFVSNDILRTSRFYVKDLNIWSRDYALILTERFTRYWTNEAAKSAVQ